MTARKNTKLIVDEAFLRSLVRFEDGVSINNGRVPRP